MPRKTTKRKYTPKRRRTRRTYRKRRTAKIIRGPFKRYSTSDPFRPSMNCKLTYCQSLHLNSGVLGIYGVEQIFRLNSLYDPDYSGVGHQPYGFDQVAALYRQYKVNACKIQLIWTNPSEDGMICAAAVQGSGGSFALTSNGIDVLKEQPMTVTRELNNTGSQRAIVNQYFPLSVVEGVSKLQFNTNLEDYSAAVNANPVRTPYLRLAVASSNGTNGASCYVRVMITYYCHFYQRKTQAQS